jgi:hypothetical protein
MVTGRRAECVISKFTPHIFSGRVTGFDELWSVVVITQSLLIICRLYECVIFHTKCRESIVAAENKTDKTKEAGLELTLYACIW